jgi:hypothetical protein
MPQEYHRSLPRWAMFALFAFALALATSPWVAPGDPKNAPILQVFLPLVGITLFAIALYAGNFRVLVYPDRIETRTLLLVQAVRYAEVERVVLELTSSTEQGGGSEIIRLIDGDRAMVLAPSGELRDLLLGRCAHARFKDYRPQWYREA